MTEIYTRRYFEGEGYKGFYFDFPVHYITAEFILERKPESAIEIGGARGYVSKLLKNKGVKVVCMDISQHCFQTRAMDDFILWDATMTPWPKSSNNANCENEKKEFMKEKEFDLCFSVAFLEHVPEEKVNAVIKEMIRVSKSGLHGITFEKTPKDDDKTHVLFRPKEWWMQRFNEVDSKYPVEIVDKEVMELGPFTVSKYAPADGLTKLNIGSFTNMYHYGWINVDAHDLDKWAKSFSFRFEKSNVLKGLNYPSNSVDLILASHFLEHLDRSDGETFLKDCSRVLKSGGLIRLAVPDTVLICQRYLKGQIKEFGQVNVGVEEASDDAEALFRLLFSGHGTLYDSKSLKATLRRTGFVDIKSKLPFESQSKVIQNQTLPSFPSLSFYVEARKPKPEITITEMKNRKLNIGLLSTRFFGVPPSGYSGLEQIVWNLACELDKMGHKVTLFAPKGSVAPPHGKLVETGEALHSTEVDWFKAEQDAYWTVKDNIGDLDILHGHNWFGFEYLAKLEKPQLKITHTHHGGLNRLNLASLAGVKRLYKLNLVAISDWMADVYASQGFASRRCYNGVDLSAYQFQEEKGERFLFLGRVAPSKAPHIAIEAAKRAGACLDIVGATSFVSDSDYVDRVKQLCDGEKIRFVGEVNHSTKLDYLRNAKGLLIPSTFGEPFGLISIEAMACGTAPIALNDGALKEIIINDESGYICNTVDEMVFRMKNIGSINHKKCRRRAQCFSTKKMTLQYVNRYQNILDGFEW